MICHSGRRGDSSAIDAIFLRYIVLRCWLLKCSALAILLCFSSEPLALVP